ncbi:MAG: aspartate aminotransferase family protein [Solirubrobacteraceae bacterium]
MTTFDELRALDRQSIVGTYARLPAWFVRGEGARLWDADGAEYLDFLTGISVSSVGHCHPKVVEAICEQAGQLIHTSNLFYTEPMIRLADRLRRSSLGGRVFFTNSGAEAVEAALKLARRAKPGGEIVVVHGGFHGRTYGALSATPQESKQAPFAPLVPGFIAIPPTVEALNRAVSDRTAAVLLEPIQGESGVHPIPMKVLRAAREACDVHGAALIFDEIQTGLGRTGSMWAWHQLGVEPDAMTTAKALGGGLPIGALITGPGFEEVLQPGDHGSTFAGGPVPCAAAHAVLDVVEEPALHTRVMELGERLREGLKDLPHVVAVRQRGLMVGFDVEDVVAPELVLRLLTDHRLVANATGPATVRLLPPLIIGEAEIDTALERLAAVLA